MISTRGRYALRVMLDLAVQKKDSHIPLPTRLADLETHIAREAAKVSLRDD